jgi:predicted dehydrogenase
VTKIRMAVVGAGRLGGFHAQKLAGMEDVELVGVVDPVEEHCCRVASECHTRALKDHRTLFAHVDGVVIAAPTRLHRVLGLEFLQHGVHVLMEKPLAATRAEACELVEAAERRGLVLQVGHVERFNPAFSEAARRVQRPKFIQAVRASGFTFRSTDIGVVLDLMIHDLDLVLSLVEGRARTVDALGFSVLGGHEDVADARIRFSCGAVASLRASRVSYEPVRRMSIWSPRAFASIDFAARTTTLVHPSQTLLERRFDVASLSPDELEHYKTHLFGEHLPREERRFEAVDALTLELQDFLDSIRGPRSPRVPGEQGRDAVALADLILSRIRAHCWDGTTHGPVGPAALPATSAVPAPHWLHWPAHSPSAPSATDP